MRSKPWLLTLLVLALAACASVPQSLAPATTTPAAVPQASDTPALPPKPTPTPSPTLTAEPTPTATPTPEPAPEPDWVAYTGLDGNLWLVDRVSGAQRQVTQDAARFQAAGTPAEQTISYCCATWSSDGALLAYQREVGAAIESGYQFQYALWVYDLSENISRLVLENMQTNGFAWKPGERLIAYGRPIPNEFFFERSPEYAQGIWAVEVDTGRTFELVPPENDFPLAGPQWSPDGRFVSFDEISQMEGRGNFAYYDFETQTYVSLGEPLGFYDWSPDGEQLAFDRQVYVATGDERIWLRPRQGGAETPLSPDYGAGYAHAPAFGRDGTQLAYLAALEGPETTRFTLFVVDVPGGQPRELGVFEQPHGLAWTRDGEHLVFSAGPLEAPQVIEVTVADGAARQLAAGRFPAPN